MDKETSAMKYDITSIKARLHHIEEQLKQTKKKEPMACYMGKRLDDMTKEQLIEALEFFIGYMPTRFVR